MSNTEIRLPAAEGSDPILINDLFTKVKHFVDCDAYVAFDQWITTRSLRPDSITWDHVYAINSAMRARSPRAGWEPFVDTPLQELAAIPEDLDLIDGPETEVLGALNELEQITRRVAAAKGLTDMAISKVLCLIRPRFVAISDSYVRRALGIREIAVAGPQKSDLAAQRLREVHEAMRMVGIVNNAALTALGAQIGNELTQARPTIGSFAGRTFPVSLSKVRILDILLWSHVAIHGDTPHVHWRNWYDRQLAAG